ncbi:MAG: alcohol dehydrogenase catalytic domain-containing protein [Turneriella sp.]
MMKQLWFAKKNTLEWRDVAEPQLDGPGQAIVRPLAIARCDLDLPIVQGHTLFRPAFPLGHEMTAEVVALSEDVQSVQVGDRCVVNFQIVCGTCPACAAQHSPACTTVPFASNYGLGREAVQWGGGIAELVKVPYAGAMLARIPGGLDPIQLASLSDNMTDAYRTVAPYLKAQPGANLLIVGGVAESIACYAILEAQALGAGKITYFDTDRARCDFAASLGAVAEHAEKIPQRLAGDFDVTIDCSGSIDGFRLALRSARAYGKAITVSIFFDNNVPIPFIEMYNKGINLTICRTHAREQTPEVLEMIAQKKFDPSRVTSRVVDFKDAAEAWLEPGRKLIVRGA